LRSSNKTNRIEPNKLSAVDVLELDDNYLITNACVSGLAIILALL